MIRGKVKLRKHRANRTFRSSPSLLPKRQAVALTRKRVNELTGLGIFLALQDGGIWFIRRARRGIGQGAGLRARSGEERGSIIWVPPWKTARPAFSA